MKIGFDLQQDQDQDQDQDQMDILDDHFQPCSEVNDTIKGKLV